MSGQRLIEEWGLTACWSLKAPPCAADLFLQQTHSVMVSSAAAGSSTLAAWRLKPTVAERVLLTFAWHPMPICFAARRFGLPDMPLGAGPLQVSRRIPRVITVLATSWLMVRGRGSCSVCGSGGQQQSRQAHSSSSINPIAQSKLSNTNLLDIINLTGPTHACTHPNVGAHP